MVSQTNFHLCTKGKRLRHTFVSKWGLWGSNKNKSEKRTRKRRREKFVKKDEKKKENIYKENKYINYA